MALYITNYQERLGGIAEDTCDNRGMGIVQVMCQVVMKWVSHFHIAIGGGGDEKTGEWSKVNHTNCLLCCGSVTK